MVHIFTGRGDLHFAQVILPKLAQGEECLIDLSLIPKPGDDLGQAVDFLCLPQLGDDPARFSWRQFAQVVH